MLHLLLLLLHLLCGYLFIIHFLLFHFPISFFSYFITSQIQFSQCRINLHCFTYCFCSFISYFVPCSLFIFFFFIFLFLSFHILSHPRSSDVNVVFIFIPSLIAFAPSAPIWSSFHFHFLLLSSFSISFYSVLSSPLRFSDVNVVFIFITSLIAFAPSYPNCITTVYLYFFFQLLSFPCTIHHLPDSVMLTSLNYFLAYCNNSESTPE